MNNDIPIKKEKKIYQNIPQSIRIEILNKIINENYTYSEISKIYGVKYATARSIFTRYINDGQIDKKKKRQKKILVETNINISIVNAITQQLSQPLKLQNTQQIFCKKEENLFQQQCIKDTQYLLTQELINKQNKTNYEKIPVQIQQEQNNQIYIYVLNNLVGSWNYISQIIMKLEKQ